MSSVDKRKRQWMLEWEKIMIHLCMFAMFKLASFSMLLHLRHFRSRIGYLDILPRFSANPLYDHRYKMIQVPFLSRCFSMRAHGCSQTSWHYWTLGSSYVVCMIPKRENHHAFSAKKHLNAKTTGSTSFARTDGLDGLGGTWNLGPMDPIGYLYRLDYALGLTPWAPGCNRHLVHL